MATIIGLATVIRKEIHSIVRGKKFRVIVSKFCTIDPSLFSSSTIVTDANLSLQPRE